MPELGQWTFSVDREATAAAYAATSAGGVDTCGCAYCRNFRVARTKIFPATFLGLLDELGVDFRKTGEVFEAGITDSGLRVYCGWYHFIGNLETTGDFPQVEFESEFTAYLTRANAPRLPVFDNAQVVQLEFECRAVPWLLKEPAPDLNR